MTETMADMAGETVLPVDGPHERAGPDMAWFLRPLFAKLNAREVQYLVMRNHQGYPHRMHKPDVGLLVAHGHVEKLIRAFRELCVEQGWACQLETGNRRNVVLYASRCEAEEGGELRVGTVKVDARTSLTFKLTAGQKLARWFSYKVYFDEVHRRRVCRDGCEFHVYEQPDELIGLFAQWKRKGTQTYRRQILEALAEGKVGAWFAEATGLDAEGFGRDLAENYQEQYDQVLWSMVRHRWGDHTPWRALWTHGRAALTRFGRRLVAYGPIVYLTGPDGCGKTTVINGLRDLLDKSGTKHKYVYSLKRVLRFFTKRLAWLKFVGKGGKDKKQFKAKLIRSEHADRDSGKPGWRLRKKLTLLMGLVDIWLSYCLAVPYRLLGYTVLVETSPYDVFIKYHMPEFPAIEKVCAPLLPRPSVCFLLNASSEAIFARKPELLREEIDAYYARLSVLLERARLGERVVEVRTDGDRDAMFIDVWRRVLAAVAEAQMGDGSRA